MTSQFQGWDFTKEFFQEQYTVWKETGIPILHWLQWEQILTGSHTVTWPYNQESQIMKLVADECKIIWFIEFFNTKLHFPGVLCCFEVLLCLDFETINKSIRATAVFGAMKTSKYHCKLASGWRSHRNQF